MRAVSTDASWRYTGAPSGWSSTVATGTACSSAVHGRRRAASGLPRSPASTAATKASSASQSVGVGDGDAARDARLLAGDEREPGEEVRGAQRGRVVAGEELLEAGGRSRAR